MEGKISFFKTLYRWISKDTGAQNESAKLIIVVRLLILTMSCYCLVNSIISVFTSGMGELFVPLASLVIFCVLFLLSYKCRPFTAYCAFNVYILAWTMVNIVFYGWDIGVQHFIIPLLVCCFYARYGHEGVKIGYVAFLTVFRICLFFYCKAVTPYIVIAREVNIAFQVLNTFTVFASLTLISFFFSRDSQALEGKLVEYNEQLIRQASIDPLTGLHNRRSTMDYLEKLLKNNQEMVCICICDIDLFKRVNDIYGHNTGDVVLRRISETFQSALPKNCFISRWGGEEFLLIFTGHNGDEAYCALQALRRRIKELVFQGNAGEEFRVSLTFGLVEYDYRNDLTTTLKEADDKLYQGKRSGRDQIVY